MEFPGRQHIARSALVAALLGLAWSQQVQARNLDRPEVRASLTNRTDVSLILKEANNCTGTWKPSWPLEIAPGNTTSSNLKSPFPNSVSCILTYTRSDNRRSCRFVISRLRQPIDGPWLPPQVKVTKRGKGLDCTYRLNDVGISDDPDFSVDLLIR